MPIFLKMNLLLRIRKRYTLVRKAASCLDNHSLQHNNIFNQTSSTSGASVLDLAGTMATWSDSAGSGDGQSSDESLPNPLKQGKFGESAG